MKLPKVVTTILLALLFSIIVPFSPLLQANSEALSVDVPPTIQWDYVYQTMTNLSISSSGQATSTAQLIGMPGVTTRVGIFIYLERYSNGAWTSVSSWHQSYQSISGTLQRQINVTSGYWYRVKASYYAYRGNNYEHITQYSNSIYY